MIHIGTMSILCMAISIVLSVLLPVGAVVWLAVKKKLSMKAVLWGLVLFPVFALVLEPLLHLLVLGPQGTSYVATHPYLFALYGGLAAGVFEETARLVGFKWLIRVQENESPYTGISYGLGHGGIEAILLAGTAAIGNLLFSLQVNAGAMPAGMESTAQQLAAYPAYMFLISGIERVFAMVIQISLSMIVMKAVMEGKYWFYVLAIGLHAFIDFPAVLLKAGVFQNLFVLEGLVAVFAVALALLAWRLYEDRRPATQDMA